RESEGFPVWESAGWETVRLLFTAAATGFSPFFPEGRTSAFLSAGAFRSAFPVSPFFTEASCAFSFRGFSPGCSGCSCFSSISPSSSTWKTPRNPRDPSGPLDPRTSFRHRSAVQAFPLQRKGPTPGRTTPPFLRFRLDFLGGRGPFVIEFKPNSSFHEFAVHKE